MAREPGPVDAKKLKERCATLRNLIDVGPGDKPEILRKALDIVRSLRVAAEWDYPPLILEDLKVRLLAWFSDRQWRGDDALLPQRNAHGGVGANSQRCVVLPSCRSILSRVASCR
jgi:hypothetical protein